MGVYALFVCDGRISIHSIHYFYYSQEPFMSTLSKTALKVVLVILGAYGIFFAIDFGFGGFKSLGLQGPTDFLRTIDAARYGVQDSHFRFFAGTFSVIGAFVIFATTNLQKYQHTLNLIFALIFVGGIMRFTSGDFSVIFSAQIIVALFAEIVLMAILYFWLAREMRTSRYGEGQ